jgi:hypothetical protein
MTNVLPEMARCSGFFMPKFQLKLAYKGYSFVVAQWFGIFHPQKSIFL